MNTFIKDLKQKIGIVEVVGEFVRLKKAGSNYMGICPFHSERSPSFSVSEKKGIFHCFGCQKSGDQITFIQESQGLSFVDAVRVLATKAGVTVPKEFAKGSGGEEHKSENDIYYRLNHFVTQFYHQKLLSSEGDAARKYFESRGISIDTIKKNQLGFACDKWDSLYEFLLSKKAPLDKAEVLGLIKKRSDAGKNIERDYYDFYRNRIIFPVLDMKGRVIAFGARKIGNEDGPKYLNSSESPIYKKGNHFYGIFNAIKDIRADDCCIIVEGFLDCLKLQQEGIPYTVATLGTALSAKQVSGMKRYTQNIILVFDGDKAGVAAQEKAMETCLEADVVAKGIELPDEYDPDEFVSEKGTNEFIRLVQNAPYLLDKKIIQICEESVVSTELKTRALEKILPWLTKLSTDTAKWIRVEEISKLLKIEKTHLERKLGINAIQSKPATQNKNKTAYVPKLNNANHQKSSKMDSDSFEIRFIELLIGNSLKLPEKTDSELIFLGLNNGEIATLARKLIDYARQNNENEIDSEILNFTNNPQISTLIARVLVTLEEDKGKEKGTPNTGNIQKEFKDLVAKLERRGIEKRKDEIKTLILKTEKNGNAKDLQVLMKELNELIKRFEIKNDS